MSSVPRRTTSTQSAGRKKRAEATTTLPRRSNRPGATSASSDSEYGSSEHDHVDDEGDDSRAAMLAALERHQQQFLAGAGVEMPRTAVTQYTEDKGKGKSVWDMGLSDLEDEEAGTDDEESDADDTEALTEAAPARRAPQVVAFADPGRTSAPAPTAFNNFEDPSSSTAGLGTSKDMRDFMSSKVKNTRTKKFSVADIANAKKTGRPRKAATASAAQGGDFSSSTDVEEAHLSTLDTHLASLIRPLTAPTTSSKSATTDLSSLLSLSASLQPSQPQKPLKGHTPLPGNAPRTLRAGQSAANLERARRRDAAAGLATTTLAGAKRTSTAGGASIGLGREALTKREAERERNGGREAKRQRGMGGAVGVVRGGELRLSREEVERGNAMGGAGRSVSGGKRGGRGGQGGGKGKKGGRK